MPSQIPHLWFFLLAMLLMCATPIFARRILLRPVFRAGQGPRTFAQFTVTDIASLTAYFGIAAGLTKLITEILPDSLQNFTALVSLFYVLGTWYLGVQSLDTASVRDVRRRVVYLSVAVPAAYAGSMTIVVISMFAGYARWLEDPRRGGTGVGFLFERMGYVVWAVYAILWLSLILAWQVARWTVQCIPSPVGGVVSNADNPGVDEKAAAPTVRLGETARAPSATQTPPTT